MSGWTHLSGLVADWRILVLVMLAGVLGMVLGSLLERD